MRGDLVQCTSCGGVYMPLQTNGMEYYHACPPSRVVDDGPVDPKDPTQGRKVRKEAIANPRDENVAGLDEAGKVIRIADAGGAVPVVDQMVIDAYHNQKGIA